MLDVDVSSVGGTTQTTLDQRKGKYGKVQVVCCVWSAGKRVQNCILAREETLILLMPSIYALFSVFLTSTSFPNV